MEADYLARVRAALSGCDASEADEIIQSIREHIEEEVAADAAGSPALGVAGEVSLVRMAAVLEALGPPESYAPEEPERAPVAAQTAPSDAFDIGSCLNDSVEVYKHNVLPLLACAFLFILLSVCSLFILAGPLWGGMLFMMLKGVRRQDKVIELGDMFGMFGKFWPLFALFFVQLIPILVGCALLVLPGLLLSTIWMFSYLLIVDKNEGVISSMSKGYSIVIRKGFWLNLLITVLVFAFEGLPMAGPHVGSILSLILLPLGAGMIAAAYNREVRLDTGQIDDLFPNAKRGEGNVT